MRKNLLSNLELVELERIANLHLPTVKVPIPEEFDTWLISDECDVNVADLPPDVQSLRQQIMDCLTNEQWQRSCLPKLICEIPNEILIQANMAVQAIPAENITETNALMYASVQTLQDKLGYKKPHLSKHNTKSSSNFQREEFKVWCFASLRKMVINC